MQSFQLKPVFRDQESNSKSSPQLWQLIFDLPGEKVNKLSLKVIEEFEQVLDELEKLECRSKIKTLILSSGKPDHFIAGADIELIRSAQNLKEARDLSERGQQLLNRWEDLPFPTVAAVNGVALGGGCELALASSFIVMSHHPVARIGLPEVQLGFLPGMGGCVRMPRRIGLIRAMDLILGGKTLSAIPALHAGLVDACLPKENFENSVIQWALKIKDHSRQASKMKKESLLTWFMENTPLRSLVFKKAYQQVFSQTRGHYPAPFEILKVLQSTFRGKGGKLNRNTRERAMACESLGFAKLAITDISKNLMRLFFLQEKAKKGKWNLGEPLSSTCSIAVLGAGVMGGGIAQLFAEKNHSVKMKDLNLKALELGMQSASQVFQKQVQKRKINSRQLLQKLNFISPTTDYSGFGSVDLVVEAVIENKEIKQKVFQELEAHIHPQCIVASNTSSLSITEMQRVFKYPERFVGLHFFNPVSKMPLIEVIQGEKTSPETVSVLFQLSKKIGKVPIVVKDSPGFLVNRLLIPYLNEAVYLVEEGVSLQEIDQTLVEFGMPMGPLTLIDEVGMDVGAKVSHVLFEAFGARMKPCALHEKAVQSGRLGKKVGFGFYRYEGPKRVQHFDPKIIEILGLSQTQHPSKSFSKTDILERCLFPMINEAASCLSEGIVSTPEEIDLGMILGTGFPPFRGGPLTYADSVGCKKIAERLQQWAKKSSSRFEPSSALLRLEQFYAKAEKV